MTCYVKRTDKWIPLRVTQSGHQWGFHKQGSTLRSLRWGFHSQIPVRAPQAGFHSQIPVRVPQAGFHKQGSTSRVPQSDSSEGSTSRVPQAGFHKQGSTVRFQWGFHKQGSTLSWNRFLPFCLGFLLLRLPHPALRFLRLNKFGMNLNSIALSN